MGASRLVCFLHPILHFFGLSHKGLQLDTELFPLIEIEFVRRYRTWYRVMTPPDCGRLSSEPILTSRNQATRFLSLTMFIDHPRGAINITSFQSITHLCVKIYFNTTNSNYMLWKVLIIGQVDGPLRIQ